MDTITPEGYFSGSPNGLAVYRRISGLLAKAVPDVSVRTSKSQVGFRCGRRGFAYLWRPGLYLHNPDAEVVLSIALPRRVSSQRFKEIAHPAPTVWMHHLEIHSPIEVDDNVETWLREAAGSARGSVAPHAGRPKPRRGRRGGERPDR